MPTRRTPQNRKTESEPQEQPAADTPPVDPPVESERTPAEVPADTPQLEEPAPPPAAEPPVETVPDPASGATVPVIDPDRPARRRRGSRRIAERDIYDNGGPRGSRRLVARKGRPLPLWYQGD